MRCLVQVGELEHIDETVMQTTWAAMSSETELRGVALEMERIPMAVRCRACGEDYEPADRAVMVCPACGEVSPEIRAGVGILLTRIELETS